jgi:RHS repeat-associated protein
VRQQAIINNGEATDSRTVYEVGPHFELEMVSGYVKMYRSKVFFGGHLVYSQIDRDPQFLEPGLEQYNVHLDYQGSIDQVSYAGGDPSSTRVKKFSFDAYGKRRNTEWTNDPGNARLDDLHWIERGYTGHEHLDHVRLIHMNGRVQDPISGRMLSPDPVIGDPFSPQSLNPYSYAHNNPATLTDPSGYCASSSNQEVFVCGDPWDHGIFDVSLETTFADRFQFASGAGVAAAPLNVDVPTHLINAQGIMEAGRSKSGGLEDRNNWKPLSRSEKQAFLDYLRAKARIRGGGEVHLDADLARRFGPAFSILRLLTSGFPPGTSLSKNVDVARDLVARGPEGFLAWLNLVRGGGRWDFNEFGVRYDAAGNVNFGATAKVWGFSDATIFQGAGAVQSFSDALNLQFGGKSWPGGGFPWGDNYDDPLAIQIGIIYTESIHRW